MNGPALAILGATGAVGEALLARLPESALAHAELSVYASRATRREVVEYRGRSLTVRPVAEAADSGAQMVLSALPPAVAQKLVPSFAARGAITIDIGNNTAGIFAGPLVLPGVRTLPEVEIARAGGARTPSAPGWLVTTLLAPLLPLGVHTVTGLINLPANAYGRDATEELSEQVVASFNLKDPPRRRFPEGLAFDTLPEDADPGEWSTRELALSSEVSELLGVNPKRVAVMCCTQPVFSGMTAALHLRGVENIDAVEAALREGAGLATAARLRTLRPRKVMGRGAVYWGGVRPDPGGDGVHLWLAADNVAGAGAAVPIALAEALFGAGLTAEGEA